MAAERRASAVWEGDLASGSGTVTLASGAAPELPVTWKARTSSNGDTSPEELIAGAHAACVSMALSNGLSEGGNPPERLEVSATCTFAEAAKDGCPVSVALGAVETIEVEATLES